MGAWGIHTFEDDHNLDWLDDLSEQDDPIEFFTECLDLEGIDELEYLPCTGVLCTSVMIDAMINGPTEDLPDSARDWLTDHSDLDTNGLPPQAVAALDRLLEDSSEMHQLWKDNEELYPKWRDGILSLKGRLGKSV